ncbi:MAG: hypothetical protein KAG19_07590 [Methylococcales bacterium]|nr:hypothetical protein [Methylococcales bacterium]
METAVISGKTYTVDTITKEKEEYVRLEAVDMCFALRQLTSDPSALIRTAVARKKFGHPTLVKDKAWRVRATVAKYTDDMDILDQLVKDENDFIRYIIVKREHALTFYLNDPDEEIASIARYLTAQKKNEEIEETAIL